MTAHARNALAGLLAIALAVAAGGCTMELPDFRRAPNEQLRQTAQVNADLATALAQTGTPPRTAAARTAAANARTLAGYTGAPTEPVDITALLDDETTRTYDTLRRQREALDTRDRVHATGQAVLTRWLADVAAGVAGKAKIAADAIVPRLLAIVETAEAMEQVRAEIRVPPDPDVDADAARQRDDLAESVRDLRKIAAEQANRPVTVGEVSDRVEQAVDSTLDRGAGLIDKYGPLLLALGIGIPTTGGTAAAAWQRSKRKKAEAAAATTKAVTDEQLAKAIAALAAAPPRNPPNAQEQTS